MRINAQIFRFSLSVPSIPSAERARRSVCFISTLSPSARDFRGSRSARAARHNIFVIIALSILVIRQTFARRYTPRIIMRWAMRCRRRRRPREYVWIYFMSACVVNISFPLFRISGSRGSDFMCLDNAPFIRMPWRYLYLISATLSSPGLRSLSFHCCRTIKEENKKAREEHLGALVSRAHRKHFGFSYFRFCLRGRCKYRLGQCFRIAHSSWLSAFPSPFFRFSFLSRTFADGIVSAQTAANSLIFHIRSSRRARERQKEASQRKKQRKKNSK